MARVTLVPTGQEFAVREDEDILTAALHSGVNLRYGCRHGNCSSCKHWLVDGDVDDSAASVYAIPRSEREDGAILLCCTFAQTDLVIEIDQHEGMEELPPMEPPAPRQATVLGVRGLTPALVELRVEVDEPVRFHAGQYVEIAVAGTGERRSYSLLNPPGSGRELVFCIKRIPGGVFDGYLEGFESGTRLDLEAPFGTMFLRDTGRPVVAAAIGSGIAPILSILTDAADRGVDVPIRFYYGARTAADLVYRDEIAALSARLPGFSFVPCLSQGGAEDVPGARAGRLTRSIAQDIPDASTFDAYLCGAPEMCDAVGRLLEAKGLPEARIHADKFYPAVEPVPARA
ncbi:2Fe-2S iron-sulfur cluster-binding protein [Pseudonocardia sp. RS010]|uniref:2Fe-2S iron-sulfur cluster-binding protein n=1 Tax=Pseudonocardia sp. RS010 TaxID=3385979 RepID=UPI0039A3BA97